MDTDMTTDMINTPINRRKLMKISPVRLVARLLLLLSGGVGSGVDSLQAQPRHAIPPLSPAVQRKIEAAIPPATVQPRQARRILVFWRCEGFFHGDGIAGGNHALAALGRQTGAYSADFSDDYGVFASTNLAKYDALVLNNTTQLKMPDASLKQALLDFVRSGKGVVGIHAATDSFYDWPEGAALLGGLFDGHPWGAGGTWAFKLDEPAHPLNRAWAGKGFKLRDEIYQFKAPYTRADRRVLVSLDLADPVTGGIREGIKRTDGDFAVAWVKKEGPGRVFYCSLGHAANVFQDPAVLRFYLDGLQFALGDLEADARPRER